MTTPSTPADSALVDQAKTFTVLAYVAAVTLGVQLLVLLRLLPLLGPGYEALLQGDVHGLITLTAPVWKRLIGFLPVFCYLGGLLAAARIFDRVSQGRLFSAENSKGLAEVGSSLLWGAASTAVIVPFLLAAVDGMHEFGGIHLEPETWVIAVVGGAILVLGRMMANAQKLEDENLALKAELRDFV
jgi:hypothetical protein